MSVCCKIASGRNPPGRIRRAQTVLAWIVPSVILALMPKCPACLVAYVALWTGVGLSLSTASYLRGMMLLVCAALLLFLIAIRLGCVGFAWRYFRKEVGQCNTK